MSRSSDLIERHWDITSKLAEIIEFFLLQFNDIPFPKSVAGGSRTFAKRRGEVRGWVRRLWFCFTRPAVNTRAPIHWSCLCPVATILKTL